MDVSTCLKIHKVAEGLAAQKTSK